MTPTYHCEVWRDGVMIELLPVSVQPNEGGYLLVPEGLQGLIAGDVVRYALDAPDEITLRGDPETTRVWVAGDGSVEVLPRRGNYDEGTD